MWGGSFDRPCMHSAGVVVVVGPLASNMAVRAISPETASSGTSPRAAVTGMSASFVIEEAELWWA